MSYFGKTGVIALTEPVPVTGGYIVLVGMLTGKQSDECQKILNSGHAAKQTVTSMTTPGNPVPVSTEQVTEMTVEFVAYRDAMVLRGIRSWNLDEEDGSIAPIDLSHVQLLLEGDRNKIFLKIREMSDALTKKVEGESQSPH